MANRTAAAAIPDLASCQGARAFGRAYMRAEPRRIAVENFSLPPDENNCKVCTYAAAIVYLEYALPPAAKNSASSFVTIS